MQDLRDPIQETHELKRLNQSKESFTKLNNESITSQLIHFQSLGMGDTTYCIFFQI